MLYYAVVFRVIAPITGVPAFGSVSGTAAGFATSLFLVLLALFAVPLIPAWRAPAGRLQPSRPVGSGRTHSLA
jgi:uncharacterized membrane protein YtjA (UPF0391 family)